MATQQEVIKKFMESLDTTSKKGEAALDSAIKSASNSAFNNFTALKKALLNDAKNADFLKTYCGIDYDTKDSGAITGKDAGSSTTKTDASVIPESGSLKTYKKTSFTKKGLTVKLGDGKTYKKLTADQQFIWNGLYTWWVEGALNLIEESYGENFSFTNKSSATLKEMSVTFYEKKDGIDATTSSDFDDDGNTYKITLKINMYYWKSLKDNLTKANTDFDRVIAHEFTHAVMRANTNGYSYKSLPGFVREGLAELTIGVENKRSTGNSGLKNLAATSSKLDNALDVNNTGTGEAEMYSGGFIFFRYLARQASDFTIENTTDKSVQTFYGNDYIKNFVSSSKIITGAGKDTIHIGSDAKKVTIDSGTGNDFINNWGASARITTGTGNDTVHNSSLSSSVYISTGTGNDSIKNSGSYVTIDGGTGDDTIFNYGAKKITITGGSGADTIANWGGAASMVGGSGNDIIWGNTGADTLRGGADNDKLLGGAGNDRLYGDSGSDTLWGEAGNDSLWGGTGADTFIYTANEGTDTIFDYEKGDMLKILKADGSNGSFKSYKYSGGDLTLTIDGGGKIIFDDVSSSTQFNINGTNYKISGSKLKKQ